MNASLTKFFTFSTIFFSSSVNISFDHLFLFLDAARLGGLKMLPIILMKAADFLVIAIYWTGQHRKHELCDLHTGTQDNRNTIDIGEFQRQIQVMPGIDKTGGIVDDEANA